jgi:hypothetical protein
MIKLSGSLKTYEILKNVFLNKIIVGLAIKGDFSKIGQTFNFPKVEELVKLNIY